MIINACDMGILPGNEISEKINRLFSDISAISGDKTLRFQKGIYYIKAKNCPQKKLYITNTIGDKEFKSGETPPPHLQRISLYLNCVKNLKIEGNGAHFVVDGKATNMALENSENVELRNFKISVIKPDMHTITVIKKAPFYIDFEIDSESEYEVKNGRLFFKGADYKYNAIKKYRFAWHNSVIKADRPDTITRISYLFAKAVWCLKTENNRVRMFYLNTSQFSEGDIYHIFDVRRQYVGIFVNKCKNISLFGIKQHFNYSLAFAAQNSENISIDKICFAAGENSPRKMASVADFIQICMCKGKVSITNSFFDGAEDDLLNVHGMYLKIIDVKDKNIIVKYMHPQSHGYNAFHKDDELAFIDPKTLCQIGKTKIVSSELINEYEIRLCVENSKCAKAGYVVENITMYPSVYFANNYSTRIITRGLLFTTRGNVLVEKNHFKSTVMSGIFISDDAKDWYESGQCENVVIKENVFDYCGAQAILIKPENEKHFEPIHKNIKIIDNNFKSYNGACISIKDSSDIFIKGNKYSNSNHLNLVNCKNVISE